MPFGIQNDLSGKKFGHMTVLSYAGKAKNYISLWECSCACGSTKIVRGTNLSNGNTTSCGCVHGLKISSPITHHQLLQIIKYDPLDGSFSWLRDGRGFKSGDGAGTFDVSNGYALVTINSEIYFAHRLAWFYMTGEWPHGLVDHKNRIKIDNSWKNLRQATGTQNNGNHPARIDSVSGLKGVSFLEDRELGWRAMITENGKMWTIGYFSNPTDAAIAYDREAMRIFGEFARLNFQKEAA